MSGINILRVINKAKHAQHPFHVLGLSRLPITIAALVGSLALFVILKLQHTCLIFPLKSHIHFSSDVADLYIVQFLALILIALWGWGRELVKEATYFGYHTSNVVTGLKYGMLLFLASEAILFFPFFWAFFMLV